MLSDGFALRRRHYAIVGLTICCNCFGQCDSDLGLTGGDNVSTCIAEGRHIPEMDATCEDAQIRVE